MSVGPAYASNILASGMSFVTLERTLGMPQGGPKCIPVLLDFTVQDSYSIDLSNLGIRSFIDMVQTVFVDLSTSAIGMTVDCPTSRQTLKIKPGTQGYYPILCPNPIKLTFTCVGGPADAKVELLNFPVPPGQWSAV